MENVLLAIHMIACAALVIAVLLQRSEGGALGMSGGGTGGIISGRGAAGLLVKVTMGLAATFIVTSLAMTRLNAERTRAPTDVERDLQERGADQFDPLALPGSTTAPATTTAPAPATTETVDPLAPVVSPTPAPTQSVPAPPAATPTPTPAPAQDVQPQPEPTPAPENGGSPN